MKIKQEVAAKAEMLIRRPVDDVFEAFLDPEITSRFWFTKGSGRLEPGKQVRWDWEMYHASVQVHVKAIERNKRILLEWGEEDSPTRVEWTFTSRPDHSTFVSITEAGFRGEEAEIVQNAIASTEAFTLVLAGLKAYLEHNINLNLVADRFPDGIAEHETR